MVEPAAGVSQAAATPPATLLKPVNQPVDHSDQQTAHNAKGGLSVAPGNRGSPPGLTQATAVASGVLSSKQEAANAAVEFPPPRSVLLTSGPGHRKSAVQCVAQATKIRSLKFMAIALRIYGLAHAEILVQRARGTPIGLAYAARENVLMTRSELAYAQQWLADEPENPAARAEVARCQQACLTAWLRTRLRGGWPQGRIYSRTKRRSALRALSRSV
jgi:hypothetical protein